MNRLLLNQKGITLLEVLVTTLIIVGTILSIYIGVVYAEKQVLNNYRDRVALLLASGEMDRQNYLFVFHNRILEPHPGKQVLIDNLPRGRKLMGTMSIGIRSNTEQYNDKFFPYETVTVTVRWLDPANKKQRNIVLVEDFYW